MQPKHTALAPSLALKGISKHFGGVMVLEDLNFDVVKGRVHGLIGPNGAGKTTAINIATGHYRPDAGSVFIEDQDVTQLATHARAAKGLGRTFQRGMLFGKLNVRTNLRIAVEQRRRSHSQSLTRENVDSDVEEVISASGLSDVADETVAQLPFGFQKRVEMARAAAFAQSVLLLDEPTAGLSGKEIEVALSFVLSNSERLAILIIEHNMDVVMSICHSITVIDAGRQIATGTPEEIQRDQGVIDAYLGT